MFVARVSESKVGHGSRRALTTLPTSSTFFSSAFAAGAGELSPQAPSYALNADQVRPLSVRAGLERGCRCKYAPRRMQIKHATDQRTGAEFALKVPVDMCNDG